MLNRREFFHSLLNYGKQKDENLFVLPPYNFNRSLFYKFCQECQKDCVDACSRVCKEGIIKSNGKSVYVDFRVDGCKLCGECAISTLYVALLSEAINSAKEFYPAMDSITGIE